MSYLIIGNITLESLLLTIVGLIILWIIVSIPVWLAGKAVTGGKATFGEAMIATLFGPIVYVITLLVVDFLLGAVVGSAAYVIAFLLALIAWVWVYKASFKTGWLGAIAIAILAWIIFLVLSIILGILFGVIIPHTFFPQL